MRLIRTVEIHNFRSVQKLLVADLDAFVPLVGLNGTGKSNVLRALNLFFTGQVEPGRGLDLSTDHYRPGAEFKGRRRIAVAVSLDLNSGFKPRDEVRGFLKKWGSPSAITVERAWTYVSPQGLAVEDSFRAGVDSSKLKDVPETDRNALLGLIRSVQFRYIPNHVRPSDVLNTEIQVLRRALVKRVRSTKKYREGGVAGALAELSAAAKKLFQPLERDVVPFTPELRSVSPDMPSDFAELAFDLGVRGVSGSGAAHPPELQGSGTQSFLLLHALDLVDKSLFGVDFGWTKAVVWAIEEPESFLHAGLRSQFATDLLRFAQDDRRQILVTTHQDEFIRIGEHAWLVALAENRSTIERLDAREALAESSRRRIATVSHPLFSYPDHPLVLVEGKTDVSHLRKAAASAGLRPRWKLACLEDIEPGLAGGDAMNRYLGANKTVLRSRAPSAPVLVLRDWEVSDGTINDTTKVLAVHERSVALRCPADIANPQLGQKFRGIERYLPTDLIETVIGAAELQPKSLKTRYPLGVERNILETYKSALVKAHETSAQSGTYMDNLARWLDKSVEKAVHEVAPESFLM